MVVNRKDGKGANKIEQNASNTCIPCSKPYRFPAQTTRKHPKTLSFFLHLIVLPGFVIVQHNVRDSYIPQAREYCQYLSCSCLQIPGRWGDRTAVKSSRPTPWPMRGRHASLLHLQEKQLPMCAKMSFPPSIASKWTLFCRGGGEARGVGLCRAGHMHTCLEPLYTRDKHHQTNLINNAA